MTTVDLRGRITEDGALEVRLPAGLPSGDVFVRLRIPDHETGPEAPRTDEEVQALMSQPPMPREEFLDLACRRLHLTSRGAIWRATRMRRSMYMSAVNGQ